MAAWPGHGCPVEQQGDHIRHNKGECLRRKSIEEMGDLRNARYLKVTSNWRENETTASPYWFLSRTLRMEFL